MPRDYNPKINLGEFPPDFELPGLVIETDANGKSKGVISETDTVKLSSLRGKKPVCMIMSSYTWPPFTSRAADMERLYASYNKDVEFLIVYIREAHPDILREDNKTGIVGRPKDINERTILASECVAKYKFTIPMVIDGMDGKVNDDYKAWPVRVTVTDIDGKVAFYAGPGPFDFRNRQTGIISNGRRPSEPKLKFTLRLSKQTCCSIHS